MNRIPALLWILLGLVVTIGIALIALSGRPTQDRQSAGQTVIAPTARWPTLINETLLWVEGNIVRRQSLASQETVSIVSLPFEPIDVTWSPNGMAALVRHGDEPHVWGLLSLSGESFRIHDLHPLVINPAWSSDGTRILYSFANGLTGTLTVASPDGTDWQSLIDLPNIAERLWWPGGGIYGIGYDIVATPPQFLRFHISSRTAEPITATYYTNSTPALPSPDGTSLLLQTGTETAPTLTITSVAPGELKEIGPGLVSRATWLSSNKLLSVSESGAAIVHTISTEQTATKGNLPDIQTLVGYTQTSLFVESLNGELRSLPFSAD